MFQVDIDTDTCQSQGIIIQTERIIEWNMNNISKFQHDFIALYIPCEVHTLIENGDIPGFIVGVRIKFYGNQITIVEGQTDADQAREILGFALPCGTDEFLLNSFIGLTAAIAATGGQKAQN